MLALARLAVTRASLTDDDQHATSPNEIRRMFTALCGSPPDEQHARPNGHDGTTATSNKPATATTSDNNYKITKCGWSTSEASLGPPSRGPGLARLSRWCDG